MAGAGHGPGGPVSPLQARYRCKTSSYHAAYKPFERDLVTKLHAATRSFRIARREQESRHMIFAWDSGDETENLDRDDHSVDLDNVSDVSQASEIPPPTVEYIEPSKSHGPRAPTAQKLSTVAEAKRPVSAWREAVEDAFSEEDSSTMANNPGNECEVMSCGSTQDEPPHNASDDRDRTDDIEPAAKALKPKQPLRVSAIDKKPTIPQHKPPFAMYGWKSESKGYPILGPKETFNVHAGTDDIRETAVLAKNLSASPKRPSQKAKNAMLDAALEPHAQPVHDSVASVAGSNADIEPVIIESRMVANASVASTNGSGVRGHPIRRENKLRNNTAPERRAPHAKRPPFAMYGYRSERHGFPMAGPTKTFNVKAEKGTVQSSSLRAQHMSKRRKPGQKGRAHLGDKARRQRNMTSEPLVESEIVRQASVASTRGSEDRDGPQIVAQSRRQDPLSAVYAKLALESQRRKGEWHTEYRDNFHKWPSKPPAFSRPVSANIPGGPHDAQIWPVGFRARQYNDDDMPKPTHKAWR